MLRTINALRDCAIKAGDGEVGSLYDFYLDDESWTIRYILVATGTWLAGRKVLISAAAIATVAWDSPALQVAASRAQIENSPSIDTEQPISRRDEKALLDHYGYPYYWTGPYLWGSSESPSGDAQPTDPEKQIVGVEAGEEDVHLRSVGSVTNYSIQAKDGEIGYPRGFLIDDKTWKIRYMIVDTGSWWPRKKVLVSPDWIASGALKDSKLDVDLFRDAVKTAPEYTQATPVDPAYEKRLYAHYSRLRYSPEA
jgi:hypothetical protein